VAGLPGLTQVLLAIPNYSLLHYATVGPKTYWQSP